MGAEVKKGGWYDPKINRYTLKEFGRPDEGASFKDVNSLPYGEAEELQARYAELVKDEDPDSPSPEVMVGVLQMVIELLVEWNISHPKTGEPMERPTKPEHFAELPMEVITSMFQEALSADAGEVPKEN